MNMDMSFLSLNTLRDTFQIFKGRLFVPSPVSQLPRFHDIAWVDFIRNR